MISKTRMVLLVKEFRWRDVKAALDENPGLIGFRDKKGRNWLHLCCGVNIKKRRVKAADSIRTAETLVEAGLDINEGAFTEGKWKATPLWYSVAFGQNLALSKYLLKRGSDPNHCLWAAAYNNDAAAIRLLIQYGAEKDPSVEDASLPETGFWISPAAQAVSPGAWRSLGRVSSPSITATGLSSVPASTLPW